MAGDLESGGVQVHAAAVLDYWFALSMKEQFTADPARDRAIAERFGPLRDEVVASRAAAWRDDPGAILAAIILIDQFSRNIHRGSAEAFRHDPLALELALLAIGRGWDRELPAERRAFAYMPLMHAEHPAIQALCVDRFSQPGLEANLPYAVDHAAVIERFGRFPSRNAALGRSTTAEEQAWLDEGGGW